VLRIRRNGFMSKLDEIDDVRGDERPSFSRCVGSLHPLVELNVTDVPLGIRATWREALTIALSEPGNSCVELRWLVISHVVRPASWALARRWAHSPQACHGRGRVSLGSVARVGVHGAGGHPGGAAVVLASGGAELPAVSKCWGENR